MPLRIAKNRHRMSALLWKIRSILPLRCRNYTLYFRLVKVQLSSFVTLFSNASIGPFIPNEAASTDAILARAGEFEGLNFALFDVAIIILRTTIANFGA